MKEQHLKFRQIKENLLKEKNKKKNEAARDILGAMEKDDSNGRPGQIVSAYHLGLILESNGKHKEADAMFKRVVELGFEPNRMLF